MAILLNNNGYGNKAWMTELPRLLPDFDIHEYPHIPAKEEITYALVWDHPKGDLARYPNLKAVLSLGAGVEHLAEDETLPESLPIIRLIDPAVANDMAMHSLFWSMNFHRHYHQYQKQQLTRHWQRYPCPPIEEFKIGVVGLGNIGSVVAHKVASNGYPVLGWDLFPKDLPDIQTYSKQGGLEDFLAQCDVVINTLPLTDNTESMINQDFFAKMKSGSFFINISRGAVVNETDLIDALDQDKLAAAALDAFAVEPLPNHSPLWAHEKIHITPHMSGATYARSAAKVIAENIQRVERNEAPFPLYDRARGF